MKQIRWILGGLIIGLSVWALAQILPGGGVAYAIAAQPLPEGGVAYAMAAQPLPEGGVAYAMAAQPLPDGPGRALVEQKCSTCHGLGNVVVLKLSENEWDFLVGQMISNGAQVNAEERKQIVGYLTANFGKGQAAPTAQAVDGAKLYASCAGCHGANGAGSAVFPPLATNVPEILKAKGGREYLVQVLLYGLQGQMTALGKTYNAMMPAWGQLKDEEIAAVLNHISSQWENQKLLAPNHKAFGAEEVKAARGKPMTPQQVLDVRKSLGLK